MTFGLLGYPLTHSFSKDYFTDKFTELGISNTHRYLNFELADAIGFRELRDKHPDLRGVNVTIPHKRAVMQYLDEIDPVAARIGAVNCIRFDTAGKTIGFNTDYLGFQHDFYHHLQDQDWTGRAFGLPVTEDLLDTFLAESSALVLGTGGASLAVHEALRELGMSTQSVSRSAGPDRLTYADLSPDVLQDHLIVVNTTPLGTYPKVDASPSLPYSAMTRAHFCYDLVYNPPETAFLRQAREAGAAGANGMGMLRRQAEAGWAIWQE